MLGSTGKPNSRRGLFVLVVTYEYDDRVVEIPGNPTSFDRATWLMRENNRLNGESAHVLAARVYSMQDYRTHVKAQTVSAALES